MKPSMLASTFLMIATLFATAQTISISSATHLPVPAAHIIVPQTRSFGASATAPQVTEVKAGIEIVEQVATVTLDIVLTNATNARLESQMIVPVPEGAVLRGFTFQGSAAEPTAELIPREEARRIYDQIVAQLRDPALLEFLGCNVIRSSVFPVEPCSWQAVRITYEHLLPRDGDRVDFVLPRTESIDYRVPWRVGLKIRSKTPIGAVYSPSHSIETVRPAETAVSVRLTPHAATEPGPFRLSYLLQRGEMTASLLAYPDVKIGGGYFLLLAGAPARAEGITPMKREVILVLDRSGSMAGEKLEQALSAALQVIEGLDDGEAFNIIVYNETVELFSPEPVIKNEETLRATRIYLRNIRVRGGTNIHDALAEALRMRAAPEFLPLVLFLTDGLPTVGQTSERAIRELAEQANPCNRRVFTFGVGVDVNTPLLDRIAVDTRGVSTFVLPREDVEVKVGQVFGRLSGPVLAGPALQLRDAPAKFSIPRVRDLLPSRLPDLFEGDQLIVLGQYLGEAPIECELRGHDGERERVFQFRFDLDKATTRNAFVPRLWASRKIAVLTDAIRDLGADLPAGVAAGRDPRAKELVEEIVRLSKQFGILSEYTAFLALEGTDLARPSELFVEAFRNFDNRAMQDRTGWNSVNQSFNNGLMRGQAALNARNVYYDSNFLAVEISTVQQVNDRAFYQRGNRWVDSGIAAEANAVPPRVVEVGSEAFWQLSERLAAENRQGAIALKGEILLRVGDETVLVK
jgi:Ca-activated chloride channel homolog